MKKLLFIVALTMTSVLMACCQPVVSPVPDGDTPVSGEDVPDAPKTLKVTSYNIRYDNLNDGYHSWSRRKSASIAMLEDIKPDVFGIQEALSHQVQYLAENTTGYSNVGVGRDDGVSQGEFMAIFWNTDIIKMDKWGHSGFRKHLTNLHLDGILHAGDFNMFPEDERLAELDNWMTSTRKIAKITDNKVTTNGFGKTGEAAGPIDYIYITGFKSVLEYRTITRQYAGKRYISDHYPIISILEY